MITTDQMKTRVPVFIILAVLACLFMFQPAIAGEGDGSGGGQGVPLGLASSSPADGQTDVALTGEIKLTFNKNVINLTLRENNKKCFSLSTASGLKVPIEVIMADDQLYPEEKRNITIKSSQPLQPGTAYILKISPALQAKNGTSLGHEVTVNFVTVGAVSKPVENPPAVDTGKVELQPEQPAANPSDNNSVVSPETDDKAVGEALPEAPAAIEQQQPEVTSTDAEPLTAPGDAGKIWPWAALLLAAVAVGLVYYRRRNAK